MNAYGVQALKDIGIEVGKLGCVMLDVEPLDLEGAISPEWEHSSQHPDRRWISGVQTGTPHVTLLYGLLSNAHQIRPAIDEVMEGWDPGTVQGESLEVFPSPFPEEDYSCIVSRLAVTPALRSAHARLSLLPHIDTHPEYKPHVTIAYVKSQYVVEAVRELRIRFRAAGPLVLVPMTPVGLNYGYLPSDRR